MNQWPLFTFIPCCYGLLLAESCLPGLYLRLGKMIKENILRCYGQKCFQKKEWSFLSILNQNLFGTGNVKKRWDKLEKSLRHLAKSRNKNEALTLKFSEIQ
jgi:hypothetical protein